MGMADFSVKKHSVISAVSACCDTTRNSVPKGTLFLVNKLSTTYTYSVFPCYAQSTQQHTVVSGDSIRLSSYFIRFLKKLPTATAIPNMVFSVETLSPLTGRPSPTYFWKIFIIPNVAYCLRDGFNFIKSLESFSA